ncbi:class I SAM-dependent methyltransferase [Pullulanibacillus sp. KACC 23026]|uniref:class I SAM-dependent methyltransferase n=1 Tax=Pullulanibacillus sp. KACC 23026 TaxID=3028315 RepID=UPI0023B01D4A|nr:class I SAM-dependent methyltransferase [Pullulanibacillus sp. KACC 23026]WEG10983.1 class I SAM-dependent methyltransferase [Pullulanibacillus sp. KACC 23026]
MEPINRFNKKSLLYSKFRPDYPDQLVIDLKNDNHLTSQSYIADIGSGTGILTKKLLDSGFKVYAVEPNDEMRRTAEVDLQHYEQFTSVNGSAEHTTLADRSVDLITVAQAFHWFDLEQFRKEAQRIIKPSGKVAVISNERIIHTAINQDIAAVYKRYCPNFIGFSNGLLGAEDIYDSFFAEDYSVMSYENPLIFNKEQFIGRHLSSSFALTVEDEFYPMLVEALNALFDKYSQNGEIKVPNVARCRNGSVRND